VNRQFPIVICGTGPAGLTAAYRAAQRGICPLVLEKSCRVGGLARTEVYKGYRFDLGGHRFFTRDERILQLWMEILGPALLRVTRRSRVYYRGRSFEYPLEVLDALANLGLGESLLASLSYLRSRIFPHPEEKTFEQWIVNRFGRRLYETFFRAYTEKVWGIPCSQIHAEWAAQRIRGLSFAEALKNAVTGGDGPRILGPGMMWEKLREKVEALGGTVRVNTPVLQVRHQKRRISSIVAEEDGRSVETPIDHFVTSMALPDLILQLDPPAPPEVVKAACQLSFRAFLLVGLIIDQPRVFEDNWLYIHSPSFKVGRIQNYKNWSPAMVPDSSTTSLGMEYFCNEGDEIWNLPDLALIEMASFELTGLGLVKGSRVIDAVVFRQSKAYPVYTNGYQADVHVIQNYLDTIENLRSVGRNGMHRYNNMDHSMLSAMLAVENILGADHDHWNVNTDPVYHEEHGKAQSAS
jgi:protoporphyrinogen oxidase